MFLIDDLLEAFALPAILEWFGGGAAAAGAAEGAMGGAAAAGGDAAGAFGGGDFLSGLFGGGADAAGGGLGADALGGGLKGGADALSSLPGMFGGGGDAMSAFASAAGEGGGGYFPSFDSVFGDASGGSIFSTGTGSGGPAAVDSGFGLDPSTYAGTGAGEGGAAGDLSAVASAKPATASAALDALPATSGGAEPGFFDNLISSGTKSVMGNPLGIALAGGGLAYNIAAGQSRSANQNAMAATATQLGDQGKQLMSYLQSGTLPPGLQQSISNATAAAKARIVANHAQSGRPTDPSQNSALAQELNQVDLNATSIVAQQAQQLLTTGMSEANMSTQLYNMLEQLDRQQSQRTGTAIASFASALSGGSGAAQQRYQLTPAA